VVQTRNVDDNPTMWERPTSPFHRTNWVCGPTPVEEHSAGSRHARRAASGLREAKQEREVTIMGLAGTARLPQTAFYLSP